MIKLTSSLQASEKLQGVSSKATDQAKSVDQSYGVSPRVNSLLSGLTSYYEKATNTPTGQKLVDFYTQTSRQVQDIHAEARRLADLKKQDTAKTTCESGSDTTDSSNEAKHSEVKSVKTSCNCGGDFSNCSCVVGHCACESRPLVEIKPVPGTDDTICNCCRGGECVCEKGHCACNHG
jgi:hypothetical protein